MTERKPALRKSGDIYCDCDHPLMDHTDTGHNSDAGLCLYPGCDCPEFVEELGEE